jgi:ubiquinone/menaquinone biosynthesis C-methylase UbiE
MQTWNEVFKREGRVFTEVQEDIPEISKLFKQRGVKKILDLGFGTGRHTVYFARQGFSVYGIDIAREGLRLTRSWLKQEDLEAKLRIGNIYEPLPYPDRFFDAIVSVYVIHHSEIENIRKLIREMERILVQNGLIFISVSKRLMRKARTIAPRTVIPLEGPDKGLVHYIFSKRSLKQEFRDFRILRISEDSTGHHCLLGELQK